MTRRFWLIPICAGGLLAASAIDRGMEALRAGNRAAAIREFEKAVAGEPQNAHFQNLLGQAYQQQNGSWKARGPLTRACDLNPREPHACTMLGWADYRLGYFDQALVAYTKGMAAAGEQGEATAGIAITLEALGRSGEAEPKFREAIAGGNAGALLNYAKFLVREGRAAESLPFLEKASVALPGERKEIQRIRDEVANPPSRSHLTPAAARGIPPIRFVPSVLAMVSRNGAVGDKHLPETVMGGVAVFDFDGDGWPDIFVTNGATFPKLRKPDASWHNRLFRNNRDGTFSDVTVRAGLQGEGYALGVAAADFDNDGHEDLFVTGVRSNTLYRNRGDGTFEDVTARSGLGGETGFTVAAGWFDYDNDGLTDLFVVRYVVWDVDRDAACSSSGDGHRSYCSPKAYAPVTNLLYHNLGGGRFRNVSGESGIDRYPGKGMSVAFGDMDGDGRLDAFVTNDKMPNSLFHNEGHGQFREMAFAAGVAYNEDGEVVSSMGTDFRDYDNDGREDLTLTALPDEMFALYRNIGGGQFANMTSQSGMARQSRPWSGWSTGFYDLNNDGLKDLFVAGGHVLDDSERMAGRKSRLPNVVFTNRGGGTFKAEPLTGDAFHRGAAFGDFDRDGKVDVVVTRLNENPLLLRNTTPDAGHWIALRLEGTRSNRDGLGAMVHVTTAGGEQWNRASTAVGYASSSDRIVHFGIGRQQTIRSIEIAWPSGIKQRVANPAADRYLTVREPQKP